MTDLQFNLFSLSKRGLEDGFIMYSYFHRKKTGINGLLNLAEEGIMKTRDYRAIEI